MGTNASTTGTDTNLETVCPVCATALALQLRTTSARALCFCLRCGRTFELQLDLPPVEEH